MTARKSARRTVAARACLLKSARTDGAQARGADAQADGRTHGADAPQAAQRARRGDRGRQRGRLARRGGTDARGADGQADERTHGAEIEDGAEVRALTGDLFPVGTA